MALHDGEELDDDLGGRPDEDLALATALGIDDVVLCMPHQHHPHVAPAEARTHEAVVLSRAGTISKHSMY